MYTNTKVTFKGRLTKSKFATVFWKIVFVFIDIDVIFTNAGLEV
jgi:hypothetical protein